LYRRLEKEVERRAVDGEGRMFVSVEVLLSRDKSRSAEQVCPTGRIIQVCCDGGGEGGRREDSVKHGQERRRGVTHYTGG
jgi:hypothetical protein